MREMTAKQFLARIEELRRADPFLNSSQFALLVTESALGLTKPAGLWLRQHYAPDGDRVDVAITHLTGCGETTLYRARQLLKQSPDLADRVRRGEKSVYQAHELLKARRKEKKAESASSPRRQAGHRRLTTLAQIEAQLELKMEAFLDAADLLRQIREEKLCMDEYGSFVRYLRERWGLRGQQLVTVDSAIDAPILASLTEEASPYGR